MINIFDPGSHDRSDWSTVISCPVSVDLQSISMFWTLINEHHSPPQPQARTPPTLPLRKSTGSAAAADNMIPIKEQIPTAAVERSVECRTDCQSGRRATVSAGGYFQTHLASPHITSPDLLPLGLPASEVRVQDPVLVAPPKTRPERRSWSGKFMCVLLTTFPEDCGFFSCAANTQQAFL